MIPCPSADAHGAEPAEPLPTYALLGGRHDELRAEDGSIRPAWRGFLRLLGAEPADKLRQARAACEGAIADLEVSMNVYGGERTARRPWPLDPTPLLVPAEDWERLVAGAAQRARLLNAVLGDLYGPQRTLRSGLLPAALVSANPQFLPPCAGPGAEEWMRLHTCAIDVARAPDGNWWVLRDRVDAPSGLGYSLQNRILVRQALDGVIHGAPVERLDDFFRGFRTSLASLAPGASGGDPRVAFLTAGPASETHYEQAYLARHLGYPLLEGSDLTTRDGMVFLRTVGGLKRVETLVRRVDSAYCDPVELLSTSLLGVPGLLNAAHRGGVALANPMGAGAVESTALLAFLPALSRALLGEELRLPSVATWWCGQETARDSVLSNLGSLVIKPAFRSESGPPPLHGADLPAAEREALAARIRARPADYCGQELVRLGTTPAWIDGSLRPAPFVLRLFVTWNEGEYHVMPGGLTRFQPAGDRALVTLRHGGVTKDTWVLRKDGVDPAPMPPAVAIADPVTRATETPSRLADGLFWLGRYLERTSQLAHLLAKLDPPARREIRAIEPAVAADVTRLALQLQGRFDPVAEPEADAALAQASVDPGLPTSLASNLRHLIRNLDQVKTRLPSGAWRCLRHLRPAADAAAASPAELTPTLAALDAIVNESLARDTTWRFLTLGRHLERALHVIHFTDTLIADPAAGATPATATEFRLQSLLHFTEALFSYRSLHRGWYQPEPVLAWLLSAPENPRGLRLSCGEIGSCLGGLPDSLAPRAVARLRAAGGELEGLLVALKPGELTAGRAAAAGFLHSARSGLGDLSDRLTRIYFTHAVATEEDPKACPAT